MEENQSKLPKGVSFDAKRRIKKFKAVIKVDGKTAHLGYFRLAEEAHQAYLAAKSKSSLENK